MLKKILLSPWTALITLALILSIRIADPVFVESVRLLYFDQLIVNKPAVENNVYTVDIDEATLDKHGQWPLPRNIYADLVENLYKRGAGLVVLNVFMSETDRMGGDGALAATMNKFPVVLPSQPYDKHKNKPRKPSTAVIQSEFSDQIVNYGGIISNVPLLESRAAGVGIVNTMTEVDGKVRRLP
jgi:adenylate cyclase